MSNEYVYFVWNGGGDLVIILRYPGGYEFLHEWRQKQDRSDAVAFLELVEYQICNGWTELSDMIALFSCPFILSDEVTEDDDGNIIDIGTLYYYNDWAIRSPLDELLDNGRVTFKAYKEN